MEILPSVATFMDLETLTLSEVNQSKTNYMIALIRGIWRRS